MPIKYGIFPLGTFFHSKKPSAGMRQRRFAFAFFLDGGVSEAAYRGAQTFDRFVANPEGFCQCMFQGFALSIEGLPGATAFVFAYDTVLLTSLIDGVSL